MNELKQSFIDAAKKMCGKNPIESWGMCEVVPTPDHANLLRRVMSPVESNDGTYGYWAKGWGLPLSEFIPEKFVTLACVRKDTEAERVRYNALIDKLNLKGLHECRILGLLFMAEFVDSL